jgi:2,3-bisphosphoglycerate-dependent phosphoglycerate mutase
MDEIPFQKYLGICDRPHGTALSAIINYYDPGFNCDGFKRIWFWMPYIVRMDFSGTEYVGIHELLAVERGY